MLNDVVLLFCLFVCLFVCFLIFTPSLPVSRPPIPKNDARDEPQGHSPAG